jgi:hypothetical protein
VVGACGVGVHAGAFAHGVESGEDFDGGSVVGVVGHYALISVVNQRVIKRPLNSS